MNNDIINRTTMIVIALHSTSLRIPDPHSAILRARDHPLSLCVERDAGDVIGVAFEDEDRLCAILRGGRGAAVGSFWDLAGVEGDFIAACDGEEGFVGRDAEAVYLAVVVRDLAAAEA